MKKIAYLYIVWTIASLVNVDAQQSPVFSQYLVNKFLINPAVAGGSGISTVNLVARQQYLGFKNAPRTFALSAQTRLMNDSYIMRALKVRKNPNQASRITNVGLGANMYSDRNGIVNKTGIQLTYAYHINFNNRFQLSMGLSGSVFQYKLDDDGAYIHDSADPLLTGNKKQFWVPDATAGVYVTDDRFFAGFSLTDLFGSTLKLGSDPLSDNFRTARNYNTMAGYRFSLDENFLLEPSVFVRATKYEVQTDFSTRLFFQDEYWLGVAYRTNKTLISMVGVSVDMFYFGYAYDASLGSIRNYSSGSHELVMGLKFGSSDVRRFRWIKKDESDFDM